MLFRSGWINSSVRPPSSSLGLTAPLLVPPARRPEVSRACLALVSVLAVNTVLAVDALRSRSLSARSLRFLARWRSRSYARLALRTMFSLSGEATGAAAVAPASKVVSGAGRVAEWMLVVGVRAPRRIRKEVGVEVNTGIMGVCSVE